MDQFGSFDKCFECSPGAWIPQSGTNHPGPDPSNLPYPRTLITFSINWENCLTHRTSPLTSTHHQIKLLLQHYLLRFCRSCCEMLARGMSCHDSEFQLHKFLPMMNDLSEQVYDLWWEWLPMKICRLPTFFNWLRLSDSIHHVMTLTSKTRYASLH